MTVRWSGAAIADLRGIYDHIAQDSHRSAAAMVARLRTAALLLEQFPNLGRRGIQAGTRELVVARTSYIIAYRLDSDAVVIVNVWHGAQQRPE
jgi:toxin ParE1/3/4